jgi:hypothetical protein
MPVARSTTTGANTSVPWQRLEGLVAELRPKLLVLDTFADLFGGEEHPIRAVPDHRRGCGNASFASKSSLSSPLRSAIVLSTLARCRARVGWRAPGEHCP